MILLLGGTSESLAAADFLNKRALPFIVSVVSDYGAKLAVNHAQHVKKIIFTSENFGSFCRQYQINLIIDATHPFAKNISLLAIDGAAKLTIPYLRFERQETYAQSSVLKMVKSRIDACQYLKGMKGKIYLSTGSKTAPDYAKRLGVKRLHVRVLPTARVMKKLAAAGFLPSQIDAIQGPFSTPLNIDLFQHAHAKAVVTKDSGRRGGVQEKIAACQKLNIPCVMIQRPQINYPRLVKSIKELNVYLKHKL